MLHNSLHTVTQVRGSNTFSGNAELSIWTLLFHNNFRHRNINTKKTVGLLPYAWRVERAISFSALEFSL